MSSGEDTGITRPPQADDELAEQPLLYVVSPGPYFAHQFVLGDENIIGRSHDAHISIHDEGISRHHASLTRTGSTWVLEDLESTNGTFVDEQRVSSTEVVDQQTIRVGGIQFQFFPRGLGIWAPVIRQTQLDDLTQVYLRRYLLDSLTTEFNRARRYQRPLSFLILDLDHFKRINDEHGHQAGDAVLRTIGPVLCLRVREQDVFGRYGGEEFGAVLPETGLAEAMQLAEALRAEVYNHIILFRDIEIDITASIGVAEITAEHASADDLIAAADRALYAAKEGGRNRVVCSTS